MDAHFPTAASIVVIGGGVMGCSVAYHLATAGQRDVVLLERNKLTSGTTWHSAAQVRTLRASASLTQLIKYGVQLYQSLEAETGQATGWKNTGSLTVAGSADRMTALRRMAALARAYDVEAQVLGAAEAKALWPAIDARDLHGAVLLAGDGRVNPSDLCAALSKGARAKGVRVIEDAPVTGIDVHRGRPTAVHTPLGTIATEIVIDCAGLWGQQVAALAGVSAPLHACEHFYILTKPIPGLAKNLPTLGDPDGHLYMREEGGGMLVGCFEPRGKALPLEKLPKHFAFGLLPDDWEHFEPMMLNAIRRVPALEHAEIRTFLNGPESFTFDDRFLLGEAPGLRGFFVGCGMNSVGVATAAGAGRALAEWVIDGRPSMDLYAVDIKRAPAFLDNARLLRERVPETLGLHYAIPYPGRENTTARDLRRSPLHARHVEQRACFGARIGWERPLWFAPPGMEPVAALTFGKPDWLPHAGIEHMAVRTGVALLDQTPLAKFLLCGRDAARVLDRVCVGEMDMPVGRLRYTAMLDERAGFVSDFVVMRLAETRFMIVTGAAQATRDADWIQRHTPEGACAELVDVTAAWSVLGIMGPGSRDHLAGHTTADLSNEAFPYNAVRKIDLGTATVWAARVSYVGELGWELYVPSEWTDTVYRTLAPIPHAGLNAMASLRIEKGFRAFGVDIGADESPVEAGLGFLVAWSKPGGFIGQDALLRRKDTPAQHRIVSLTLDDPDAYPIGDEPVLRDGHIVGTVSSAAFGHALGRAVALAAIRLPEGFAQGWQTSGRFELDIAGQRHAATLHQRAPYDPAGARMRG